MPGRQNARMRVAKRSPSMTVSNAPPEVYALRAWSVKKVGNKWYISPTACFENKPTWSRPYASLHYATTAIARKLAEEVLARQKWRAKVYGPNR